MCSTSDRTESNYYVFIPDEPFTLPHLELMRLLARIVHLDEVRYMESPRVNSEGKIDTLKIIVHPDYSARELHRTLRSLVRTQLVLASRRPLYGRIGKVLRSKIKAAGHSGRSGSIAA